MTEHYDTLETREPAQRQTELIAAVAAQVQHAKQHSPTYAEMLAEVAPQAITSAQAIAALPLTRKATLMQQQKSPTLFGGLAAYEKGQLKYLFSSPGPIYEPATFRADYWRFARALFAAGFRRGDVVQNCFSYHLTPAGAMGDSGCHALGCAVIPAGVGQTEQQVATMQDLKPNAYFGTPSFLKIILQKADEVGADCASLCKALVSGEALPKSLRNDLHDRGVRTLQAYGTADVGLIAYESRAEGGLIIDEQVYVEIVRPGGGQPVADGEVGEVVVTALNPDYPLIRFATGDLSAIMPGRSDCGRTNRRLVGWLGRADQTAKVRGMFVHPTQINQVLQRHTLITRARLVIERVHDRDRMTLKCELHESASASASEPSLLATIADSLRELCKVRGEVEMVARGSLPNDGVMIEDLRPIEP